MAEVQKKHDPAEDPVLEALRNAPIDDEPETEEERRSIDEAIADEHAGRILSHEEVRKRWLEQE